MGKLLKGFSKFRSEVFGKKKELKTSARNSTISAHIPLSRFTCQKN